MVPQKTYPLMALPANSSAACSEVQRPGVPGLDCRYQRSRVRVCRIEIKECPE